MHRRLGIAVVVAVIAAACGGVVDPSKNQVETFTGTIQVGGLYFIPQTFQITKTGEISVTVTSLTPAVASGTYFTVALGQSISGQCATAIQVQQFAVVGVAAINGPITPGSYCVVLGDSGLFTVNEDFSVRVSHP